jgi:hypothetical protein
MSSAPKQISADKSIESESVENCCYCRKTKNSRHFVYKRFWKKTGVSAGDRVCSECAELEWCHKGSNKCFCNSLHGNKYCDREACIGNTSHFVFVTSGLCAGCRETRNRQKLKSKKSIVHKRGILSDRVKENRKQFGVNPDLPRTAYPADEDTSVHELQFHELDSLLKFVLEHKTGIKEGEFLEWKNVFADKKKTRERAKSLRLYGKTGSLENGSSQLQRFYRYLISRKMQSKISKATINGIVKWNLIKEEWLLETDGSLMNSECVEPDGPSMNVECIESHESSMALECAETDGSSMSLECAAK